MSQLFKITTLDSKEITIGKSENLEINMGGISLLNLADRQASYSNSFKIPRAANELIFSFAGNFSRLNKPIIPVVVSSGLFNKKANLKVLNANDSSYSCSVEYSEAIDKLTALKYESLFNGQQVLGISNTPAQLKARLCDATTYPNDVRYLYTTGGIIPATNQFYYISMDNPDVNSKSLFIKTSALLSKIATNTGLSISGNILSDVDFINSYVGLTNTYVQMIGSVSFYATFQTFENTELKMSAADLLKQISLLWFCDITINGTDIVINKIDLTTNGVYAEINTFKDITKNIYSGLAKNNIVKYSISDTIIDKSGLIDTVIGDGVGDATMIETKLYVPEFDGTYYNLAKEKQILDKVLIVLSGTATLRGVNIYGGPGTAFVADIKFLSITGFYSSKLNSIFTNSQIIEASCWVDPFTANKIMTERKIISQQLGGTYWVDTMAYSLTSNIAKFKLIKL